MCRFVAYLGKESVVLADIIEKPKHSLIKQSRDARESEHGFNADGFGIGWYEQSIRNKPVLFKSIQPAWNDLNLRSIAQVIRSNCFIGHVRASTVGDVTTYNCHPFSDHDLMFAHNGTIRNFKTIRRDMLALLEDDYFDLVKGQTDSEHFFALMAQELYQQKGELSCDTFFKAFTHTLNQFYRLRAKYPKQGVMRINSVLTDGTQLIATRFISDPKQSPISLYYAKGHMINTGEGDFLMAREKDEIEAVLIASEELTSCAEEWHEIPVNHALMVSKDLTIKLEALD